MADTMETTEIRPLAREALVTLLADRNAAELDASSNGRRRASTNGRRRVARWPFPGTAELWIPDDDGPERYALATSLNVSLHGVGVRCDEQLTPGLELMIAIHEPEVSLHGRAVVRHCTEIEDDYLIGLEFIFDD